MKGMSMMLDMFGLKIPPEQIEMLQKLIPLLPAKVNELIQIINTWDARFKLIQKQLEELNGRLGRDAGTSGNV
jgi:hypothetical protein